MPKDDFETFCLINEINPNCEYSIFAYNEYLKAERV
jgi:hypothetical protein